MYQSALNDPILVLNKSWYPIDSTTVKESFSDVISEKARFLDIPTYISYNIRDWMNLETTDTRCIYTSTHRIKVPEVILLTEYSRIPKRTVIFNRRNLWRRDGRLCQYCGAEPHYNEITIDHVNPKSQGGSTDFFNCVLCCLECNLRKANRTLQETGMALQRRQHLPNGQWTFVKYDKPKRPIWNPLYALSRKTYPKSWAGFLKHFDEALYWEVELET